MNEDDVVALRPLKPPNFVTFPVAYDPNFGDTDSYDVETHTSWIQAATQVVFDPAETRQKRLEELRKALKARSVRLQPGDDNQLLAVTMDQGGDKSVGMLLMKHPLSLPQVKCKLLQMAYWFGHQN